MNNAKRWFAVGIGAAVGSYAALVASAWLRYGETRTANGDEADELLDRFMPVYDVVERHHVRVAAPADVTLAAAAGIDPDQSAIVRAIFKGRELAMGSRLARRVEARGFVPRMRAMGWGVLDEVPDREIVMGAVTQPWLADVVFRALPPGEFAAFREPGFAKIVWTLRADPIGDNESIFRTETRVATTDRAARARFRQYWSFVSPGIVLIRWLLLAPVRAEAERRMRERGFERSGRLGRASVE
jgi:hypothetical protein